MSWNLTRWASAAIVSAFFFLQEGQKLVGMNASGRAPLAADARQLREMGCSAMPALGMRSVTTPGALAGWADAVARFGRLGLADAWKTPSGMRKRALR
ncbi:gamma-glutamyltransferase [Desulfosarcina cetonica]|uniref:gamma-glutamyltransferase n=1 Tax=Desulfosarcina cetonica TaxID=90730 RepID=UPI0006CF2203|nr:gamma-glutamyltransferase [Desulfosarcina cetonica]